MRRWAGRREREAESARAARLLPLLLAASCALSSCVYYNGMYNANKYMHDAEASERAGRTSEARDRWTRAELHAESVAVHHPNSRWADDARLVQGRAYLHLTDYSRAVVALQLAVQMAQRHEQKLEALLLLGEAQTALQNYDAAAPALDSAVGSGDRKRRDEALLARGRLRLVRDPEGALADLVASGAPGASLWRARAEFTLGRPDSVARWLGEAAQAKGTYRETEWLPLLDSLAAAGRPDSADAIAMRLMRRSGMATGQRARLLLAACDRAGARGEDSAAARCYRRAAGLAPDSAEGRTAAERIARMRLLSATDDSTVAAARADLAAVAQQGGAPARDADPLLRQLARMAYLQPDSADAGAAPDVRCYLRAEIARDSLGMTGFAAAQFASMADRFPDSPWTPKALLAAIAAGHPAADSLRALLLARYPDSPYAAVARGGDSPRYAVLEDSLRTLAATIVGTGAGDQGTGAAEGDEGPVGPHGRRPVRPGARPAPGSTDTDAPRGGRRDPRP